MRKYNNYKPLFAGLLALFFGFIGNTFAYFGTNNTFSNIFNAGDYVIESSEVFESPTNWKPGDETPKQVTVTNKGDIDAAVRVWLEESWEDKDGNSLPIKNNGGIYAADINFADNSNKYWLGECDGKYYYYYKALEPNEATRPFIESVTFSESFYDDVSGTPQCTTEGNTQICNTSYGDYAGGKYTLTVHIETVQYSEVYNVWGHPDVYSSNNQCEPLNIRSALYYNNALASSDNYYNTFGKSVHRNDFESITTVNNMNIPNNAIEIWDVSETNNGTVMAWYTDSNNNGKYEFFLGANGTIYANPNSKYAFSGFNNVNYADFRNLDTSRVTDMRDMFSHLGKVPSNLTILGIEEFDVSNVTTMNSMFAFAGGDGQTIDFGNWDTSNVVDSCFMFENTRFTHIGIVTTPDIYCDIS